MMKVVLKMLNGQYESSNILVVISVHSQSKEEEGIICGDVSDGSVFGNIKPFFLQAVPVKPIANNTKNNFFILLKF